MADAFRSARLIYRAIEDNDDDISFFHSLRLDTDGRTNFEPPLLKPVNKASSTKLITKLRDERMLSVLICLPVPAGEGGESVSPAVPKPVGILWLNQVKEAYDPNRNNCIAIQIAPEYQRKGYGTEAIEWMLEWAFKYGGLHRVEITCFSYNPGARRLYERMGFVYEGTQREVFWYDGGWHDRIMFSLLENEWRKRIQEKN